MEILNKTVIDGKVVYEVGKIMELVFYLDESGDNDGLIYIGRNNKVIGTIASAVECSQNSGYIIDIKIKQC